MLPKFQQVHFLPYGEPEPRCILGTTDRDLHERPAPGFLCFRSWDTVRLELLRNRVSQRPADFIDRDDQHMTVEVRGWVVLVCEQVYHMSNAGS